jgi:hypothetical protein
VSPTNWSWVYAATRRHAIARDVRGGCRGYFCGLVALPSYAGWVGDAMDLMGTRVSVELWADDEARPKRRRS